MIDYFNNFREVDSIESKQHLFSMFGYKELNHYPFLVIDEASVSVIKNPFDVFKYVDESIILYQWEGQYRSDFFKTTVGGVKKAVIDLLLDEDSNIFSERYKEFLEKVKVIQNA